MRTIVRTTLAALLVTAAAAAAAHTRHMETYGPLSGEYGAPTAQERAVLPPVATDAHATATGGPAGGLPSGN